MDEFEPIDLQGVNALSGVISEFDTQIVLLGKMKKSPASRVLFRSIDELKKQGFERIFLCNNSDDIKILNEIKKAHRQNMPYQESIKMPESWEEYEQTKQRSEDIVLWQVLNGKGIEINFVDFNTKETRENGIEKQWSDIRKASFQKINPSLGQVSNIATNIGDSLHLSEDEKKKLDCSARMSAVLFSDKMLGHMIEKWNMNRSKVLTGQLVDAIIEAKNDLENAGTAFYNFSFKYGPLRNDYMATKISRLLRRNERALFWGGKECIDVTMGRFREDETLQAMLAKKGGYDPLSIGLCGIREDFRKTTEILGSIDYTQWEMEPEMFTGVDYTESNMKCLRALSLDKMDIQAAIHGKSDMNFYLDNFDARENDLSFPQLEMHIAP